MMNAQGAPRRAIKNPEKTSCVANSKFSERVPSVTALILTFSVVARYSRFVF